MNAKEENKVEIGIKRIKVIQSSLKELNGFLKENIQFSFNYNVAFNVKEDTVNITVNVLYYSEIPENEIASFKVSNEFLVKELSNFAEKDNALNFPNQIMATLISIAISHTRALLSQLLKGSEIEDLIFPLIPMDNILESLQSFQENPV